MASPTSCLFPPRETFQKISNRIFSPSNTPDIQVHRREWQALPFTQAVPTLLGPCFNAKSPASPLAHFFIIYFWEKRFRRRRITESRSNTKTKKYKYKLCYSLLGCSKRQVVMVQPEVEPPETSIRTAFSGWKCGSFLHPPP